MATRGPRVRHLQRPAAVWLPAGDGTVFTISDADGSVIATISGRPDHDRDTATEDAAWVVSFTGDVDQDTAPLLQRALILAINDRPRTCLDMSGIDFFGAAGVRALAAADRHAISRGRSLSLRGVHGIAERVLTVVALPLVTRTD